MAANNANAKTLTINEVAERIEINPRVIRKALRASFEKDAQPGRGGRWVIRESDIEKVRALVESVSSKSATVADFGD